MPYNPYANFMPPQQGYPQQQGPGAGAQTGYDPFNPMYLWQPMNRQMDEQSATEAAKLNERFGAGGGRFSSPLMAAQGGLIRKSAEDKQRIMSELMYKGAQDAYGRQKDASTMGMQLGQMQDSRDEGIANQLAMLGGQEQAYAQQAIQAMYQEFLRQQGGYVDQLAKLMGAGGGYRSDFFKDPTFWDKYGNSVLAAFNVYMQNQ